MTVAFAARQTPAPIEYLPRKAGPAHGKPCQAVIYVVHVFSYVSRVQLFPAKTEGSPDDSVRETGQGQASGVRQNDGLDGNMGLSGSGKESIGYDWTLYWQLSPATVCKRNVLWFVVAGVRSGHARALREVAGINWPGIGSQVPARHSDGQGLKSGPNALV